MNDIQRYIRTLNPETYMYLFDSEQYLKMYPILIEKKINPKMHWIKKGQYNSNRIAPLKFNGSLEQLFNKLNNSGKVKSTIEMKDRQEKILTRMKKKLKKVKVS